MRTLGLLALLAGFCMTGCSDDGSSGSGGSGGSTGSTTSTSEGPVNGSLEADYCAPLAAFVCSRLIACNCEVILPSGALEQAACEADYKARCLDAYAPLTQAVEQGQAHVLAAEAAACIQLLKDSTPGCERPRGSVAQALCPAWFSGEGAVGEACSFPFCGQGAGVCIDGTCEAKPEVGLPCATGGICASGLLCLDGECAAPAVEGQSCTVDDACAPPLRCVDGVCHPLVEKGGSCSQLEACALGLECINGTCSDKEPTTCGDADPCGNLTSCFAPRVCAPKGKSGGPCFEDASCEEGLRCEGGLCTQNPGLGEPCVNSAFVRRRPRLYNGQWNLYQSAR
ncbi:MAG: hypothetical protein IPK82_31085 [Polyangiaceae bacterium]|nr:hypothetical protein [Polyangiaceae bacterium]